MRKKDQINNLSLEGAIKVVKRYSTMPIKLNTPESEIKKEARSILRKGWGGLEWRRALATIFLLFTLTIVKAQSQSEPHIARVIVTQLESQEDSIMKEAIKQGATMTTYTATFRGYEYNVYKDNTDKLFILVRGSQLMKIPKYTIKINNRF